MATGKIDRYVYHARDSTDPWGGGSVNLGRCRYRLFVWHPRQCSRKPTTEIQGYGFCTQHAKIIEERIRESDAE